MAVTAGGVRPDTHHKALSLNLDPTIFGTFAEIGAGQEVARWFLRVGAASGTVAKTISAYDMKVSDDLYGSATRYVSRERLETMLDREWTLLLQQLQTSRGSDTRFFVFADTVSARNFAGTNECHGWMGVRYQTRPGEAPHQVVLHLNLRDDANLRQQEALGILGVNLVYAAFNGDGTSADFPCEFFDHLGAGRVEVDFAACGGSTFDRMDPRLPLVTLVRDGRAEAVAFPAGGRLVPPTELLHGKPVLLEPGQFTHVEPVFEAMLAAGLTRLQGEITSDEVRAPVPLCALSIHPDPEGTEPPGAADTLRRLDVLQAAGFGVLVFRRRELYHMTELVKRFTRAPIRFVIGVSTLAEVFQDQANETLSGALLEALARLFASNVRVFVYPMRADVFRARLAGSPAGGWLGDIDAAAMVTADGLRPAPPHGHLYQYLLHTDFIVPLSLG